MKMNFNLNLIQTQKLIMTPELKQAIEILQFNALELNEFINEELLNNPILEKIGTEAEEESVPDKPEQEFEYDLDKGDKPEVDWEEMVNYFDDVRPSGSMTYNADSEVNYDNFVADEENLRDYLLMQLKFSKLDPDIVRICEYIIENIDDNGYLQMKNEEAMVLYNKSFEEIEQMVRDRKSVV